MILLKKLLWEIFDAPAVVLGAVKPDHDVVAVTSNDDYGRHPQEWVIYLKWRYVPDLQTIYWWEPPEEIDKELAKDYLTKRGFSVRKSVLLTAKPVKEIA